MLTIPNRHMDLEDSDAVKKYTFMTVHLNARLELDRHSPERQTFISSPRDSEIIQNPAMETA